ncbi:MAG: O-antigen ligase family protein [Candidatus Promineifilaceae bacterium]
MRRQQPLPYTPFNWALLIFEIGVFIGILVSNYPMLTLPKATGIIFGLTLWRLIVRNVNSRASLRIASWMMMLVGAGLVVFGILGIGWSIKAPFLEPIVRTLPSRILVIPEAPREGVNANQLAGILVFYLPLLFSFLVGSQPRRAGKGWLAATFFSLMAVGTWLLLTQSRSGWIGGLAGVLLVLLLWFPYQDSSNRRRLLKIGVVIVLLVSLTTVILISTEQAGAIRSTSGGASGTGQLGAIDFRLEVWKWALNAPQDFPLTGVGLGAFRQEIRILYPVSIRLNFDISHAHNIFMQVGVDFGLFGLISYLAVLIIAFVIALRAIRTNPSLRSLTIGLLSALGALHVYGMVDALAPGSKPGMIYWMAIGLIAAIDRLSRRVTTNGVTSSQANQNKAPGMR